jgi:hypothetical protein
MSTVAVALVSAVIVQATAAAVDFSGYWIPDPGKSTYTKELKRADSTKSDAPPAPPGDLPAPPPLRIATGASEMVVEFIGDDGTPINTVRLATDGRTVTNPRGMLSQVSTSHWDDGAFVTVWQLNRRNVMIMKGVDKWRLSPDGRSLTIESRMEDSKSRSTTNTTYKKKN